VTHNPTILEHFPGHHCLEVIHSNRAIAYVLKYCTKNSDAGQVRIQDPNSGQNPGQVPPNPAPEVRFHGREVDKNEKLAYFAATRILSAPECFAQICGFWRHHLKPTVMIFTIQLEGKKVVLASSPSDALQKVEIPSPLERYFRRPRGPPYDPMTFLEYHSNYVSQPLTESSDATLGCLEDVEDGQQPRVVRARRKSILCMLGAVHVANTELFAMRLLLRQFPARKWRDLRTHNGTTYETFGQTVRALGIIADRQDEARIALADAAAMNRGPSEMRFLLAEMVRYGANRIPLEREFARRLADEKDTPDDVRRKIDQLLDRRSYITPGNEPDNRQRPNTFDPQPELAKLNRKQRSFTSDIIRAVQNHSPQLMFLQGSAGTGKTHTVRALISILRAMGKKCLIAATTGIAAVQYHGGCTLHSLFKLGFDERAGSTFISGVGKGTPHADYLMAADLVIIDEVSMLTPWVANRVSMTLKSISPNREAHFGGKQILFVGDFLQLPPVVPGFAVPVIRRLITLTPYWTEMAKFQLTEPMRATDTDWVEFLSAISKGHTHPDADWARLQKTFRVNITTDVDMAKSFLCEGLAPSDRFPLDRLWIAPTNKLASQINQELQEWRSTGAQFLGTVQAESRIESQFTNVRHLPRSLQVDFADNVEDPDLPPHVLNIFHGDPFVLLRNIDTRTGLAKGRRCTVVDLRNRTAVLRFDDGHERTLRRMCLHKTSCGISFNRWQIPIRLVFAGTVHRSHGMTLGRVVIDCRSRFWEPGRLYVAWSRVKDPSNICVLLPPDLDDLTIRPFVDPAVVALLDSLESRSEYSPQEQISATQTEPQHSQEDLEDVSEPEGMLCLREFNDSDEEEDSLPPPPFEPANEAAHRVEAAEALSEVLLGAGVNPESSIGLPGPSPTLLGTLVKAAVQNAVRTAPANQAGSPFRDRSNLQIWLARNRIMFGRLLACVRSPVSRLSEDSISVLVRPNIAPCHQAPYLASLVLTLFQIQPLRRLIICWPNNQPIIALLGNIFASLELGKCARVDRLALLFNSEPTEATELLQVILEILSALRMSAPWRARSLIHELFGVDVSWQVSVDGEETDMRPISNHLMFRLRVGGESDLSDAFEHFFNEPDADVPEFEVHKKLLTSVPLFLFVSVEHGTPMNGNPLPHPHNPITFPLQLNLDNHTKNWRRMAVYQLGAVISATNMPTCDGYRTFFSLEREWINLEEDRAFALRDLGEIEDKWSQTDDSYQNAELLLYVVERRPRGPETRPGFRPVPDRRFSTNRFPAGSVPTTGNHDPPTIPEPSSGVGPLVSVQVHIPAASPETDPDVIIPILSPEPDPEVHIPIPFPEPDPEVPIPIPSPEPDLQVRIPTSAPDPAPEVHIRTGTIFTWHGENGSSETELQYITTHANGNWVMIDLAGAAIYYLEPRLLTPKI
jgi:hypothetical protein